MGKINFEEYPVLIRVYPEYADLIDNERFNYLEHLFKSDKRLLPNMTVKGALEYVINHAVVTIDNLVAKRDITQTLSKKDYGIRIYGNVLKPTYDFDGRIEVDTRMDLISDLNYWDILEVNDIDRIMLCEMQVLPRPLSCD